MEESPLMWGNESTGLERHEWFSLLAAFYALAHSDQGPFHALPLKLRTHPAGELCRLFIDTGDSDLLNEAGLMLTGTENWYVYIGRMI
jgi:hypothetical protein